MFNGFLGRLGRRANVSVEFALLSTFFLLPLFGGSADLVEIISAQAQLNTSLQALYYYALSNPTAAANTSDTNATALVTLMSSDLHPITGVTITPSWNCIAKSDTTGTVLSQSSTAITTCSNYTNGSTTVKGTDQTVQVTVKYSLTSSVVLPVPYLFGSNQFNLSAAGTVQVQ